LKKNDEHPDPVYSDVHFGPFLSESEQSLTFEDGEQARRLAGVPEFRPPTMIETGPAGSCSREEDGTDSASGPPAYSVSPSGRRAFGKMDTPNLDKELSVQ